MQITLKIYKDKSLITRVIFDPCNIQCCANKPQKIQIAVMKPLCAKTRLCARLDGASRMLLASAWDGRGYMAYGVCMLDRARMD